MRSLHRFFSHWQNWLGFLIVLFFISVALTASLLSPMDPKDPGPFKQIGRITDRTPHPPSEKALLGTLPGQVDVFHALVWGTRDALQFGLLVAGGAFIFGVLYGSAAGYAGGTVNGVMMRVADAFLTFPVIASVVFLQEIVAVTIESMGGTYWFYNEYHGKVVDFQFTPPPIVNFLLKVDPVLISLILFSWMPIARLINTLVITLKQAGFIQASRALGASPFRVLIHHLIPNSIGPAIVLAARDVGGSVILQATLTFIGIGGTSPWGILLSMGRNWVIGPGGDLFTTWWVFLPATLAIILFGVSWNLLGDGLADILNPVRASSASRFSRKRLKIVDKSKGAIIKPQKSIKLPVMGNIPVSRPSTSASDTLLELAHKSLRNNDISQAIHVYSHLIQRNRLVDETIHDLVQVVRRLPREPSVWKVLGDALSRVGNMEYAEKAYEEYRKLIQ